MEPDEPYEYQLCHLPVSDKVRFRVGYHGRISVNTMVMYYSHVTYLEFRGLWGSAGRHIIMVGQA